MEAVLGGHRVRNNADRLSTVIHKKGECKTRRD
jgi:hypothetical protein